MLKIPIPSVKLAACAPELQRRGVESVDKISLPKARILTVKIIINQKQIDYKLINIEFLNRRYQFYTVIKQVNLNLYCIIPFI